MRRVALITILMLTAGVAGASEAGKPAIASLDPLSGPVAGGGLVRIHGEGLGAVQDLTVGGQQIAKADIGRNSESLIEFTVPPGDAGPAMVKVRTASGTDYAFYTYRSDGPPVVRDIDDAAGPAAGGYSRTVRGQHLSGVTKITIGDKEAAITARRDDAVVFTVPAGSAGRAPVTVHSAFGTSGLWFTYYAGAPAIESFTPDFLPVGSEATVEIHGKNFTEVYSLIFGESVAKVESVTSTRIVCRVPAQTKAGPVEVKLVMRNAEPIENVSYRFTSSANARPLIKSLSSGYGRQGDSITISGQGFTEECSVQFGKSTAGKPVLRDGDLIVTVPAGSGSVSVTVENDTSVSNAVPFTYSTTPPLIDSLSPASGPFAGGTPVAVRGSRFTAPVEAFVDGAPVAVRRVSETELGLVMPEAKAEAATKSAAILVRTPQGEATAVYTYNNNLPTLYSIAPAAGPAGTVATLAGANLGEATAVTVGAATVTEFLSQSDTAVSLKMPAGSGAAAVTVASAAGTSNSKLFTYDGATPVLQSLTPEAGFAGDTVTLKGSNLTGVTEVRFGGAAATNVKVVDDNTVTVTAPAGTGAAYVTAKKGSGAAGSGLVFRYATATVSGIKPDSGPEAGGGEVVITGTHFSGFPTVTFGGRAAGDAVVKSDTEIVCTVPPGVGTAAVAVSLSGYRCAGGAVYRYEAPVPMVSGISPATAYPGEEVAITGTNFDADAVVTFGGVAATAVRCDSPERLTATVPAGTGEVEVAVTLRGTPGEGTARFTYKSPSVASVDPVRGPVGTLVTVRGSDFAAGATVSFGGTAAATVTYVDAATLTAEVPTGVSGEVKVTVTVAGQTSAGHAAFTVTEPKTPTLASIDPARGQAGTLITLKGTHFASGAQVAFGDAASPTVRYSDDTTLVAEVPAGVDGEVRVRVTVDGRTSAEAVNFTVLAPQRPVVSGIEPASGPAGTAVTIAGANFASGAAVRFGDHAAAEVRFVDAATLTAVVPAGATGRLRATVSVGSLASAEDVAFTVVSADAPTVASIEPARAKAGETVRLRGTNFAAGAVVLFGTKQSPSVTVSAADRIEAVVPDGSGAVEVVVIVGGNASPVPARFVYAGVKPTLLSLSPSTGPTEGGTPVTITGSNFTEATKVYFGDEEAFVAKKGNDATTIVAYSPGGAGEVQVHVENDGDRSDVSLPFRYFTDATPVVTRLDPAAGPSNGGTTVTIVGTDLEGVTRVHFGSVILTDIEYVAGSIRFVTPAGTTGATAAVSVETATGKKSASLEFRYTAPAPVVTGVTPDKGSEAGGYDVVISGSGFDQPDLEVRFGDALAGICTKSANALTVVVPPGEVGTAVITVRSAAGSSTASFLYYSDDAPRVVSVAPSFGLLEGGTKVWLTGSGFEEAVSVKFGGVAAKFQVHDDTSISAITPDLSAVGRQRVAARTVPVTVETEHGQSPDSDVVFTVAPQSTPVIASLSPAYGPTEGGNWVTISGTGFTGVVSVRFGATEALEHAVASDETITARVPPGSGRVSVTVATDAETSEAAEYSYEEPRRPDPSLDPEVRGVINAQVSAAERFASIQSGTVSSRLGALRRRGTAGYRMNEFNLRFTTRAPTRGRHEQRAAAEEGYQPVYSFNAGDAFASMVPRQMQSRWSFWSDGAVNIGTDKDEEGYDYTTYNLTLGADYALESVAAGFALGYANDRSDVGDNGSKVAGDAYSAVVYGAFTPGLSFYMEGMLGYSHLNLDSTRYLGGGFATGTRSGRQFFGSLAAGHDIMRGNALLNPYAKVAWSRTTLNEYAESGAADRALRYGKNEFESYSASLGLRGEYTIARDWGVLVPALGVEYTYNFKDGVTTALGYVDEMAMPYTVRGRSTARSQFAANAGLHAMFREQYSLGLEYRGSYSGKQRDHRVSVQAGWSW